MKILCYFGKHDYFMIKRFKGFASAKLGCKRCDRQWGINFAVKALIPWDLELQDMYEGFGFK